MDEKKYIQHESFRDCFIKDGKLYGWMSGIQGKNMETDIVKFFANPILSGKVAKDISIKVSWRDE